ncbi:type II toxin-antitoxin system RelE/ParE family toxin [Pigmentiphaga sp.]|uniref:type II toxin-antitoxin system RelE/ParE family toxin n=1 Tax=Pigmentiphaga sp. TaxID=1977564 RepID=UPI0025F52D27|nr:type II toxin-antitoxin system RelE/ParE family toxin [Pigmentiphaga sp.]
MRIFKTKGVYRFARRERIADVSLKAAIERAERGSIDANLGGGLIKQRVARSGQGRSGGFRMIVAYCRADRAVFLYGFAKNDRDNISDDELQTLRIIGSNWLEAPMDIVGQALADGDLQEIEHDDEQAWPLGQ